MIESARELTERLSDEARRLGFSLASACSAVRPARLERFHQWLDAGYAGEMDYLAKRRDAYSHPEGVLEGARSLLMLGWNYMTVDPMPVQAGQGRIARYAWGEFDYHDLIHERLKQLAESLRAWRPGARVRGVVDTAPLLEREFAELAGLGWVGKNTLLINRRIGSWFFLAALLTDQELEDAGTLETDHCGTCRACLEACPTDAFPQPYVLDASRCLSYLTIELRSAVPETLREGVGNWLFGCDVCQEVCPWNRRVPRTVEPGLQPREDENPVDLIGLFGLDDEGFRARFRRTPLWRAKRRGVLRNAAYVLGGQRCRPALPALGRGLVDAEPLVRGACAWAIGRILAGNGGDSSSDGLESEPFERLLQTRAAEEADVEVRRELQVALERFGSARSGRLRGASPETKSIDETEFGR